MRVKSIASLLLCGVTLLAVSPSEAFAQTGGRPAVVPRGESLSGGRAKSKPQLKEVFAGEVAKNRAGTMSEADIKRLEKESLFPQSAPKSHGFSKRDAALVVLIVVVIVGLAIVLEHNGVRSVVRCEDSPGTPDCVP